MLESLHRLEARSPWRKTNILDNMGSIDYLVLHVAWRTISSHPNNHLQSATQKHEKAPGQKVKSNLFTRKT